MTFLWAMVGRRLSLVIIKERAAVPAAPLSPLSAATIAFQFVDRTEDAAHANWFLMGLGIKAIVGRRRDNVIEQAGKWTVGNYHCIVFASAKRFWVKYNNLWIHTRFGIRLSESFVWDVPSSPVAYASKENFQNTLAIFS